MKDGPINFPATIADRIFGLRRKFNAIFRKSFVIIAIECAVNFAVRNFKRPNYAIRDFRTKNRENRISAPAYAAIALFFSFQRLFLRDESRVVERRRELFPVPASDVWPVVRNGFRAGRFSPITS